MDRTTKIKFLKTIIFYLIYFSLSYIMEYLLPSDMCNPGMGIAMIFLLPFILFILLIRHTFKFFMWGKPYDKYYLIPITIHAISILVLIFIYVSIT